MSELNHYYERLLQVIQNDVDIMLTNPDPLARPPKAILELLKAGQACEEALKASDTSEEQWNRLSTEARKQIDEIIKRDLGVV